MYRLIDILFAGLGLLLGLPLFGLIAFMVWLDVGDPLFSQVRVGRYQKPFLLLKFRTMKIGTESVATHLVNPAAVTKFGSFLRKTKLDELPQLWNVFKGDMSLVGPRPCLFNQNELIKERANRGVFIARPGITGLAQIKGIDMSRPLILAETDARMLQEFNLRNYFIYLIKTFLGSVRSDLIR